MIFIEFLWLRLFQILSMRGAYGKDLFHGFNFSPLFIHRFLIDGHYWRADRTRRRLALVFLLILPHLFRPCPSY